MFVLKSVVLYGTDPHQYKRVCVNEVYNLRAEKFTVTHFEIAVTCNLKNLLIAEKSKYI